MLGFPQTCVKRKIVCCAICVKIMQLVCTLRNTEALFAQFEVFRNLSFPWGKRWFSNNRKMELQFVASPEFEGCEKVVEKHSTEYFLATLKIGRSQKLHVEVNIFNSHWKNNVCWTLSVRTERRNLGVQLKLAFARGGDINISLQYLREFRRVKGERDRRRERERERV